VYHVLSATVQNGEQKGYSYLLKRSGKSRDEIGEMMGHSTSQVTEHYLASLYMGKTWEINKGLL
jgi:hypothetical protein